MDVFTDGLWHTVYADVESGSEQAVGRINIVVDGLADISNRQLQFTTREEYFVGGKDSHIILGFKMTTLWMKKNEG